MEVKKHKAIYIIIIVDFFLALFFVLKFVLAKPEEIDEYKANEIEYISKYENIKTDKKTNVEKSDDKADIEEDIISEEEIQYLEACRNIEKRNYDEAKEILSALGSYKDSLDLVSECDYKIAIITAGKGDYEGARKIMKGLGDYKNSKEYVKKYTLWIAEENLNGNNLEKAREEYEKYRNTTDGNSGLIRTDLATVRNLILEGKYEEAGQIFSVLLTDEKTLEKELEKGFAKAEHYDWKAHVTGPDGEEFVPCSSKEYISTFTKGLNIVLYYDENNNRYNLFQIDAYTKNNTKALFLSFDGEGKPYNLEVFVNE